MDESAISVTKNRSSTSPFPIESLHIDLFTLILQAVIDHEAADFLIARDEYRVKPVAALRLALVSRKWRDVVYNTPSLWPIISLDLRKPLEELQRRLTRLCDRSLNAPVDLFLWGAHTHSRAVPGANPITAYEQAHDPSTCACEYKEGNQKGNKGEIVVDFGQVTNIQSLTVLFTDSLAASTFTLDIFSTRSLSNLRWLVVLIDTGAQDVQSQVDLNALFTSTPRLTYLNFNGIGRADLGFSKPGEPLLPKLRQLVLSSSRGRPATPNTIPRFLSHAPNIRDLRAFFPNFDKKASLDPFPAYYQTITLPNLQRLVAQTFEPVRRTFAEGKIKTPILEEFIYSEWDNSANDECQKFFSLNPTIRKLHISVTDESQYHLALASAVNVEGLSIRGDGKGGFLTPLYTKDVHPAVKLPVCPKLRNLAIVVFMSTNSTPFFEELVRSRFRPVKLVEGVGEVTADGYKPVETLKFVSRLGDRLYSSMKETEALKSAEVKKVSSGQYELRWPYFPSLTM